MNTAIADYRYIVKELPAGENSAVWALECYPQTKQLPFISKTGCMYVRLKANVSKEKADALKRMLNEYSDAVIVVD